MAQATDVASAQLRRPSRSGLVTLEAMATAGQSLHPVGAPAGFVSPEAGVLVDPEDEDALTALTTAALRGRGPGAAPRAHHDVRRRVERIEAVLERAAGRPRAGRRS